MRRAWILLLAVLGALAASLAGDVSARLIPERARSFEIAREKRFSLSSDLAARFSALPREATITHYFERSAELPADLRSLGADVQRILRAIERAAQGRVHLRAIAPREHPELARWHADLGLAPLRARRAESSGWREVEVWSAVRLGSGSAPDVVLGEVRPDSLPRLAAAIAGELERLSSDRPSPRPRLALARPTARAAHYETLARLLADAAEVIAFDPAREAAPQPCDALWLLEADEESEAHVLPLALAHLDAGGELFLAPPPADGAPPARALFAACGVELAPPAGTLLAARSIAPDQDFRRLGAQPNGTLAFGAAFRCELAPERVRALDLAVNALASTAAPEREPLLLLLESRERAAGRIVVAASPDVFAPAALADEGLANAALAGVLARAQLAPVRRLAARLAAPRAPRAAPLDAGKRVTVRILCVLLVPLVWTALLLARRPRRARTLRPALPAFRAAGALAATAALVAAARAALPARADATDGRRHSSSSETDRFVDDVLARLEGATIGVGFDPPGMFPPAMGAALVEARDELARLRRAHPRLDVRAMEASEILGLPTERFAHDAAAGSEQGAARELHAALRVSSADLGRSVVLRCPEPQSLAAVRFRVAFALWRLAEEREVEIAVAASRARLSSAEAHLDYEQRGLFAPVEGDRFGTARRTLERLDFALRDLDPSAPGEVADAALLLWLQPRRSVEPLVPIAREMLAHGRSVVVAAQHFELEPRRLARDDLALRFWPRPLLPDLERTPLADSGVELVREVLLDEVCAPLDLGERSEAGDAPRRRTNETAQPFVVRALAAHHATHPLSADLGDLLLPGASRLAVDEDVARAAGFTVTPLVRASSRARGLAWQGGALDATALVEAGEPRPLAPLAVLVEGRFGSSVSARGTLLLVGSGEAFADEALAAEEFANAELLAGAVARLTLPAPLAAVLPRPAPRPGFEPPPEATRWRLRLFALAGAPLALLVGTLLAGARRVSSRR